MRKRFLLILFIILLSAAGCGKAGTEAAGLEAGIESAATSAEDGKVVKQLGSEKEAKLGNVADALAVKLKVEKNHKIPEKLEADAGQKAMNPALKSDEGLAASSQQEETEPESDPEMAEEPSQEETEPEPASAPETTEEPSQEEAAAEPAEAPQQDVPEPEQPQETPEPEPAAATVATAYDPYSVCSMAVAKCQAGGMITTTDHLAALLAEGAITQEEYNAYYPYDGLGYYSVFVETDLNQASTTSGRKLGSVEGIVDHIVGMMLLESGPVFYIEYAGGYNLNGTEFYEFRCYR